MRPFLTSIHFWMNSVVTLALGLLAVYVGSHWGGTPGMASFLILAVPACAAALSGSRPAAAIAALIAAAASFAEVWLYAGRDSVWPYVFPLIAAIAFFGLNATAVSVVYRLRRRLTKLEEQNSHYVRQLYRSVREDASTETLHMGHAPHTPLRPDHVVDDDDAVNFAMLLLTLQDIGRRVSTNLDLATLIPTIISSAKASLKCTACHVYLWDARKQAFNNPLPARARDALQYTPRAQGGMAGWVLERRQLLTRRGVEEDYALRTLLETDPQMPDAIAPLSVGGELLGILVVDHIEEDTATFERLLYILANVYALGIKNAQLFKRIEDMARHDGLTGLLNHASFQQELTDLINDASEQSGSLSIIMSDIDHFKRFNDTYGHQAGDHVLRQFARVWKAVLPDHAVLARYGGEEFICVLPNEDRECGLELAEQLRETVESHTLDFEGQQLHVTASFGVAAFSSRVRSSTELVRMADEALYRSKEEGRNRVTCSDDVDENKPTSSGKVMHETNHD
jgi:two-component system, cell cycle response regulator